MQETAEPRGACRDGVRSRSLRHLPAAASAPAARERGLPAPVASLAAAAAAQAPQPPPPPTLHLLLHRPAALLSLVPRELAMFVAGGVAGAIAKTTTAPLDRVKILMQVSSVNTGAVQSAAQTAAKGGIVAAFKAIAKSEGVLGFWRGNGPQVLRVLPYSACQLYSYEKLKKLFADKDGNLSIPARLAAGAGAACFSTVVTYPLDIIRFRMAVDPTLNTIPQVIRSVIRDEGVWAFYKGLLPSCVGIAPYSSINFAAFDLLKKALPEELGGNSTAIFVCSFAAAALATGGCYPLDTIRRQMQMKGTAHANVLAAATSIVARDGVGGLYRGFLPNAAKNLPNSSIRLSSFDAAKKLLTFSQEELVDEREKLSAAARSAAAPAAASGRGKKLK